MRPSEAPSAQRSAEGLRPDPLKADEEAEDVKRSLSTDLAEEDVSVDASSPWSL